MEIKEIKDNLAIDKFLATNSLLGSEFLVSKLWLDTIGNKRYPHPLAVLDDRGNILAIFTVISYKLIFNLHYAYSPRGPILANGLDEEEYRDVMDAIISFIKERGFIFWRFESSREAPVHLSNKPVKPIQPRKTMAVKLKYPLEDILANMHQKTRYNIRLAKKKGVSIREGKEEKDFQAFWKLINDTKDRDAFSIHGKEHYHRLFSAPSDFIKLLVAQYKGEIIAAGLFCFYGNRATYLHGASSNEHRNVMAPFLLQWGAISLAKDSGYSVYDFYGIDEDRWPGVTRFKRGFGGFEFDYPGTFEYPLSKSGYYIFQTLKSLKKLLWWR